MNNIFIRVNGLKSLDHYSKHKINYNYILKEKNYESSINSLGNRQDGYNCENQQSAL